MEAVEIESLDDVVALRRRIARAAAASATRIGVHLETNRWPLGLLKSLKFEQMGRHPLEDRDLNLIEQINQTATYLASLRAVEILLREHPAARGFTLNLGTRRGLDIQSKEPGAVAAEIFAAVKHTNNGKLKRDVHALLTKASGHKARYVMFAAPGFDEGRRPELEKADAPNIKVWAVTIYTKSPKD